MVKKGEERSVIKPKIVKSPDYKAIYTTGVFGSLTALEGRMIFYLDRIIPKIKDEPPGDMETGEIERELLVEVHMSPAEWISISEWMQSHIKRLKEKSVLVKEEKVSE